MKNRLTRNWIAVSIIWAGALIMTYLNLQTIQQIKAKQESIEFMHKDDAFLKSNFEKITQVLKQRASLHKPIDSIQIELLSLENRLKKLAQKQGLSEFLMASDQKVMQGDRIPLELHVTGTYRDLIFWLQTLETDASFLMVTGVKMAETKDREGYRFQVGIDFRFNITEGENGSA
jgi:Tfp pilus assembly protein PilN